MAEQVAELDRGRASFARRAWVEADEWLCLADDAEPLGAEDLELLATAGYMVGRDEAHVSGLERAHREYLDAGQELRAARCAFWIAVNLILRGEMARASGWLGRAERLVERQERDCAERGYLMLAVVVQQIEAERDGEAGYATASEMTAIGERFVEADLTTLGMHWQGLALLRQGRIAEGLSRLNEAMVAITAGECSPILTGVVYCSVIDGCRRVYALRPAQEWTAALTRWCDEQPGIVAFTGRCLVHRAEIMQLGGEWPEALSEAQQAERRLAQGINEAAAGQAAYRQGEVHRLRGAFAEAKEAYRAASRLGFEPQPGLALLRLAEGSAAGAAAAIRRAIGETTDRLERARLLPAQVEIMVALGHADEASSASAELEEIADEAGSDLLGAAAAHARGAVDLARGDARGALEALRRALELWHALEVPYEAACSRALVAAACRGLGDDDSAQLGFDAARETFARLGAEPDLARLDALAARSTPDTHGLSSRELEVLHLVAAGRSNREIASALVISEHTVARHLQNIFAKLGVSSRTAASAFAFAHDLA